MGDSNTKNRSSQTHIPQPPLYRPLQVFAFNPSLDLNLETARINRSALQVPWEEGLQPGPVGEYLEVVDVDPPSDCVYEPVDLNHPHLLAADGYSPSAGNPQFHQQMVYAVAMKTIANFEQALGRSVHWSPRLQDENDKWLPAEESYVPRLRIHPHALREANAYYSPQKKALLFGYFSAENVNAREGLPGGLVFTCLSHDVIAHETTHAILDGVHRRMLEASNPDVLAFHEAFADLAAIFQHFTLPGVVEQQITLTRGNLEAENLLGKLAVQFGQATCRGNALRDAIGRFDSKTGEWRRRPRNPGRIGQTFEPHARGAILVAAVFDAFLTIYRAHTSDLLRIATSGTGVLPEGNLHPNLVARLADEAVTVAKRILTICIRALDYLPPVDVTFGDYLRAMITIDADFVPEDKRHYRTAIISAFRDHGIYPRDVRTLSVESLRWMGPSEEEQELFAQLLPPVDMLHFMAYANDYTDSAVATLNKRDQWMDIEEASQQMIDAFRQSRRAERRNSLAKDPPTEQTRRRQRRRNEFLRERQFAVYLHNVLCSRAQDIPQSQRRAATEMLGVDLFSVERKFEVHAVRATERPAGSGRSKLELLVLITQREKRRLGGDLGEFNYKFRSGCTLLIAPDTGAVRYAIKKGIEGESRRRRQEEYLSERLQVEGRAAHARYSLWRDDETGRKVPQEPFQMLHQGDGWEGWL